MILSHDTTVFTTDPRFQVSPPSKDYQPTPVITLSRFTSTRSPVHFHFHQHSRYQTLCRFTFTFQVHFYPVSGIWELRISRLGEEDGGEYCCQVGESCEPTILQKLHQRSL